MLKQLSDVAVVVLACCAVFLLGLQIRREFFVGPSNPEPTAYVEDWASRLFERDPVEDDALHIVEFVDFQCPYCAALNFRIDSAASIANVRIRRHLKHYPVPRIHQYALSASVAVECARSYGELDDMRDAVFSQNSLAGGDSMFTRVAASIGIDPIETYIECLSDSTIEARVQADRAIGEQLGIQGTPTIIVDGHMLTGAWPLPALADFFESQK